MDSIKQELTVCDTNEIQDLIDDLSSEPRNVISISSEKDGWPDFPPEWNVCTVNFDDLDFQQVKDTHGEAKTRELKGLGYKFPTYAEVSKAIQFARLNRGENIVVQCDAGVSRSPAIAYVILLDLYKDAKKAEEALTSIVNKRSIAMNKYVVTLGTAIVESGI